MHQVLLHNLYMFVSVIVNVAFTDVQVPQIIHRAANSFLSLVKGKD